MPDVLKEFGTPQLRLDVHATRTECERLREILTAIGRGSSIRWVKSTLSRRILKRTGGMKDEKAYFGRGGSGIYRFDGDCGRTGDSGRRPRRSAYFRAAYRRRYAPRRAVGAAARQYDGAPQSGV